MVTANTLPTVLLIVNLLWSLFNQLSQERRIGAVHPPLILRVQVYVYLHLLYVDTV